MWTMQEEHRVYRPGRFRRHVPSDVWDQARTFYPELDPDKLKRMFAQFTRN